MSWKIDRYIDVVEVAKMVRSRLKREFPGVKFGVRSSRYAGGASIRVTWEQGPSEKAVDRVASEYEGSCLDGDYSPRPVYHYLFPDGHAEIAYISPSGAIGASIPEGVDNREIQATLPSGTECVHFGADFVHCWREPSAEEIAEMENEWSQKKRSADGRVDDLPFE